MLEQGQKQAPPSAGGAATTGIGRVGNVDVLRAAAALGVVLGHAYILGGRRVPTHAEHWYDVFVMSTVSGVWLFFAISGFVISKPFIDRLIAGRPLPEIVPYAIRRAFRIFPLYWVALTAVILIAGAGATRPWQYVAHYALLHNLVPGRQGSIFSVAWTLTLEVLFYIAVPILAALIRSRYRAISAERLATLIVVSAVLSVAFTALGDMFGLSQTGLWLRTTLPATWQMFCVGMLLAVAPHLKPGSWKRWLVEVPSTRIATLAAIPILVVASLMLSVVPFRFGYKTYLLITDGSRPFFAIGFGLVLAYAVQSGPWFARRGRFLLRLGLISYGIYLLHAVALQALLTDWGKRFIPLHERGPLPYVVHIVYLAGLGIALAAVSWRWLETPCIAAGLRLSERWRNRSGARAALTRSEA